MTDRCGRLLTALCTLAATCGCSELDNCPDAQDDIVIDRPEATDKENLIFESAPWDQLDPFPAKTKLVLKHDLGVRPYLPKSYLSFKASGISGGNSIAEAAGNEVLYDCFDSHVIVIRNDTCEEDFFVKVVAAGSPNGDPNDDSCSQ